MSLKELTAVKHKQAEQTPFMNALLRKSMPTEVWTEFLYNKMLWYGAIESKARAEGVLDDLPGIDRAYKIYQDYRALANGATFTPKASAVAYRDYILNLPEGKILAHVYTWHMGDLFGGQRIKQLMPGPNVSLEFNDVTALQNAIRSKLNDDLADEANVAFDWAIKILNEFSV